MQNLNLGEPLSAEYINNPPYTDYLRHADQIIMGELESHMTQGLPLDVHNISIRVFYEYQNLYHFGLDMKSLSGRVSSMVQDIQDSILLEGGERL